jgi:alpha-tubulin suppressor-like RCC1 family protein
VACGMDHVLIIKNDNTVWGAGKNQHGQLGDANTSDKTTFSQINISL